MTLGPRFEEALVFAHRLHARQIRKGTDLPYIGHLLSVCALVLEQGGDEDEAIAALLHDAVEDQGGLETLEEIEARFGQRVAEIVMGLTDAVTTPKPPWRARKEAYLAHLAEADGSVLRVSLADKLHNARTIKMDLIANGPGIWDRFKGGRAGTLWYYRNLRQRFNERMKGPWVEEFARVVEDLEHLSGEKDG